MLLSDMIAQRIIEILDGSEENSVEIKRNELATSLGCVPSQINYVLTSRFTPENGYVIESRRGGGGYIKITKVTMDRTSALMHIVNSIGDDMDQQTARILLQNCVHNMLINEDAAVLMMAAMNSNALRCVPPQILPKVRAAIFKQMLMTQI